MAEVRAENAGTILVVNDERLPLKSIVATLKSADFVVLQCTSEANAVRLATNYAAGIDLVLADSQMLSVSGLTLADALRPTQPHISVILICGDVLISSYGCALICNPFLPVKLLEMVNAVLHPADELQSVRRFRAGALG